MTDERVPYPNIGAEEPGPPVLRPPLVRLIEAFTSLVEDPPWEWLASARGVVAWLNTVEAERRALQRNVALWGTTPWRVDLVHDKAFTARTARRLAIDDVSELIAVLDPDGCTGEGVGAVVRSWPPWAQRDFTVKPRRGTSGRGRIAGKDGAVTAPAALAALMDRGGAVVEPWLARVLDLSSLWFVDVHGEPHLVGSTLQRVRGAGVYLGADVTLAVDAAGRPALGRAGTRFDDDAVEKARLLVEAAAREGYVGPCGVDAFVWRDADGNERLRGAVELNARFTGGHVALGLVARAEAAGGTHAGDRFRFALSDDAPVLTRL